MSDIHFTYVILYVPDVRASIAFYERAFGFVAGFVHESGEYGELQTGATKLAFANEQHTPTHGQFALNRRASPAAGAEVGFVVSDVAAAHARAVSAGGLSALEPTVKPWGQTVAYVRDLDGFLVEICTAVG